ncbi:MAG: serine hydroxymethyltransferase, partial [Romboutsia sp.]
RLGTPAVTTRGMKEEDMVDIAEAIDLCLTHNKEDEARMKVTSLTNKYPLYNEYEIFNK